MLREMRARGLERCADLLQLNGVTGLSPGLLLRPDKLRLREVTESSVRLEFEWRGEARCALVVRDAEAVAILLDRARLGRMQQAAAGYHYGTWRRFWPRSQRSA